MEVLELSKEYAYESIPVDVVHVALLQKNVGLVQEENGTPSMANIQDLLKLTLKEPGVRAKLASRGHVERALQQLTDAFSRESLSSSWGTMEDRCKQT